MSETGILAEFDPASFRRMITHSAASDLYSKPLCSFTSHGLYARLEEEPKDDSLPPSTDSFAVITVDFKDEIATLEEKARARDCSEFGLPLELRVVYPSTFLPWFNGIINEAQDDDIVLSFWGINFFEAPSSGGSREDEVFESVWLSASRRRLRRALTDEEACTTAGIAP